MIKSMQSLKSKAHAAGYVMAVSEEYLEAEHNKLLALEAPLAERPTYVAYKEPQKPVLMIEHHKDKASTFLHNLLDGLRSGRAAA
ncbi:MAG: hypothetical protein ACRBCJ_14270 [Hyphomicrobiaceae bacterium]